jgi:hypothetical protein
MGRVQAACNTRKEIKAFAQFSSFLKNGGRPPEDTNQLCPL